MPSPQETAARALAIVKKVEDQTAEAIAAWLRANDGLDGDPRNVMSFDQLNALAYAIARGEWRRR